MKCSLDDVYRKYGETAEAAQLLETELGNLLLFVDAAEHDLFFNANPEAAADILAKINSHTLGQLLKRFKRDTSILDELETLLLKALAERNRLSHSFYRQHNWRRNSDDGRAVMMKDLQTIHDTLLKAFKAVHLISGVDLDAMVEQGVPFPTRHLPI
jgi:hypothetical protein